MTLTNLAPKALTEDTRTISTPKRNRLPLSFSASVSVDEALARVGFIPRKNLALSFDPKTFLRGFAVSTHKQQNDDDTSCSCPDDENDDDDDDDDNESHTAASAVAAVASRRSSLLRFCGNVQESYQSPQRQKVPVAVVFSPPPLGFIHPSDQRDARSQWLSLMKIGKEQMMQEPKNFTTALMAWNDALAVRVRNRASDDQSRLSDDDSHADDNHDANEERNEQQDIALTLNWLGIVLCLQDTEQNEYTAYDAFEKSLEIRQQLHGAGHADCVEVVHNMWILLHSVNERTRRQNNQDSDSNNRDNLNCNVENRFFPFELDCFRGLPVLEKAKE